MKSSNPITIFWFRRDLRLYDNHALYKALSQSNEVLPIFIFDTHILKQLTNKNDKRVILIHQILKGLNSDLQKVNSSILVIHDDPLNAFKTIFKTYHVKAVYTNHDYEPYAIERDLQISNWLKSNNCTFHTFKDQVIFEKNDILKSDASPYTVFTPYSKIWKQTLNKEMLFAFPSETLINNFIKIKPLSIATLNDMGFENGKLEIPLINIDHNVIKNYEHTRNIPALNGTSKISVALRFGTISIREMATLALNLNEHYLNELIWREFFMMILFHFPNVVNHCFKKKYENINWRNDETEFEKWCEGKTGYPIVDAGMRELNHTGLMHNRLRMIVASFLTKHLLIDWRWGEAYFAEKLLDYELSSNNGNWQWAAGCGCDAAPYFRIFNPMEQSKKFDPKLEYITKWLPNFADTFLPEIVEHRFARKRALEVYKNALEIQL